MAGGYGRGSSVEQTGLMYGQDSLKNAMHDANANMANMGNMRRQALALNQYDE